MPTVVREVSPPLPASCRSVLSQPVDRHGALAFFANGDDPFSVTLCVAGCVFAYYLTQTSFTGSIIDSYGLLWMVLPLAIMKAMNSRASVIASRFSMQRDLA